MMAENDFDAFARKAAIRFARITGRAAEMYEAFERLGISIRSASYNADKWAEAVRALPERRPGRWRMPPDSVLKKAGRKRKRRFSR